MAGVNNGYFIVEVDGVAVIEATDVEHSGAKQEPHKIITGNRIKPIYGRGKTEIQPVKIKHARAINQAGRELFQLFDNYTRGLVTDKVNVRIVQLGEDGLTPYSTYEYLSCVPTEFNPEGNKADGKEASYFTISFQPEDYKEIS